MKRIASIILLIAFSAAITAMAAKPALPSETLHYKVMYKWGLINKQAGRATLTLSNDGRHYHSMLAAASEPWADKIYRVRDTLNARMTYPDQKPLFYEKIANEGSEHKHDVVTYDYSGGKGVVAADCTRKEYKKGVLNRDEQRRLEANGAAIDMLSSFYFMRSLPYPDWKPGHEEKISIFSGKQKETLSIRYNGITNLEIDGKSHPTYHITFIFTSKGGKKSSDDMEAWISADASRVPLRLEGKLPVGRVHCILVR